MSHSSQITMIKCRLGSDLEGVGDGHEGGRMDQGIPLGWEFEVACGGLPKWLLPEQEVLRTGGGGP